MSPLGTIILINGTSSSGKTTLLEALQTSLDEPFLNAGIDKFIWMLPERYLDRPLWDDVLGRATDAGEMGHRLFSGMHHAIATLSRAGLNVVADHVLVEPAWVDECAALFADLPAYLIGVRCPLDVLEQRERDRKDRTLGQARAQFERVHAFVKAYDLEVDTSLLSPQECARLIREHIQHNLPRVFGERTSSSLFTPGERTGSSPLHITGPNLGLSAACAPILRALPEWFGIEEATQQYIEAIESMPTLLAEIDGEPVGFLTLKPHSPFAAEIYVMGVQPEYHRHGAGKALLASAETHLRQQGVEYLQVKTLSSAHPDAGYAKTRAFYQKMGFRPLEEFPTLWDEANPCLMLVKSVAQD
jgi:chloramphenicol 3-O-phosphotransferase/ribosomal protein S18 acetylase RimI-like enzyme